MAGKFVANVQGEPPGWDSVYQFVGSMNGYQKWGRVFNIVSLDDDVNYLMTLRNLGTDGGGLHLRVLRSDTGAAVVAVTDAGLAVTGALSGTTLAVSGNATVGGTLGVTGAVTGSSTLQGTRLISTVATGTAPLTVASTTAVTNLNADLLDGRDSTYFATAASLANYVLKAGDTMTGLLTLEPSTPTQQILKLKYSSTSGSFYLGANNSLTPSLILKDNGNVQVAAFGYSTDTNQLVVNGTADVTTLLKATRVVVNNTALSGSEELRVTGQSRLEGDVTVSSGSVEVSSGNIDVQGGTAGEIRSGKVIVNAASLSGTEELRVVGQSRLEGDVTITTGTFRHENTGNARIEADSTGVGFFGATPIARPTVTGSRGGNAALESLLDELANLGLITDSTSA